MTMNSYYGVIVELGERGYYVHINMGGQVGRYGPMQYVSTTREEVEYEPDDKVLVVNIGPIADNFVILGKLMEPPPPVYPENFALFSRVAEPECANPYSFPDQEGT